MTRLQLNVVKVYRNPGTLYRALCSNKIIKEIKTDEHDDKKVQNHDDSRKPNL